jgi:hypothetical protein
VSAPVDDLEQMFAAHWRGERAIAAARRFISRNLNATVSRGSAVPGRDRILCDRGARSLAQLAGKPVAAGEGSGAHAMSEPFDFDRFIKVIAMVGSSHDGEALVAARQADRLLPRAGLSWEKVLKPHHELTIAVEAAAGLVEEKAELRAELDRYRQTVAERRNGAAGRADHRAQARWCLRLADEGLVRLNGFERSFLASVSRRHCRLSDKQQSIWEDLLPEIARRGGWVPP